MPAAARLHPAFALVFALGLGVTATRSLSADAQKTPPAAPPLEVSADRLDLDVQAKTAVLSGNVRIAREGMSLSCPRVDARYDDGPQITWAKGTGGVVADLAGARAEAPEVEIDMASQTLELRGGVRIARGGGWIKAERATMHMATSKITMSDVKGSIPVGKPSP
jgi:lipopolysaccharide transport protein LptA